MTGAISTGQQGRPKVDIGREQLESLQELGFTWTAIAKMFVVSVHTLLRRRKEYGMPVGQDCYSRISDDILDDAISKILQGHPHLGELMLTGALKSNGIIIQRQRLRDTVMRVDPVARLMRRRCTVQRRTYSVTGANALWHIDGNHKLIRWRFAFYVLL